MVHSVIIGIGLGVSESPETIRPLVAAITFHQLFEGMGLGGCIAQVLLLFQLSPFPFSLSLFSNFPMFSTYISFSFNNL